MSTGSIPGLCYSFDEFTVEQASMRVFRAGDEISLPPLSARLLLALVKYAPDTLTYADIKSEVWGGRHVSATTIKQRVKLLRRSLKDAADSPRYIALVRGVGYRLIPPVQVSTDSLLPDRRPAAVTATMVRRNRVLLLAGVTALLLLALLLHRPPSALHSDGSTPATGAAIPAEARKLFEVGKFLYHRREPQDLERAREHFTRAVAIAPHYAEPWELMASLYKIMGREGEIPVAEATRRRRQALQRALELQPDLVDARIRLASLEWTASGTGSIRAFADVVAQALAPLNPLALTKKAYLLKLQGDWEAAMAAHEAAAAANPTSIAYQGNLSIYYMQRGQLADAEAALVKLLELHPGLDVKLAMHLARLRLLQEHPREALAFAEQVDDETERLPIEAMAHHLLGAVEESRQKLAQLNRLDSPLVIARMTEVRQFITGDGQAEAALNTLYAMARANPSRLGEARTAADDLLESPFINWAEHRDQWSRLSKQKNMISSWAPPPVQLSTADN